MSRHGEKLKEHGILYVRPWNEYLVNRALEIAEKGHQGQKRESGEEYIEHPIAVAQIVAGLECDLNTFLAAILHDVVEDTSTSLQQLSDEFGKDVAFIVDSLTKISEIENQQGQSSNDSQKSETLRKILVGSAKDLRVAYIKLADRLHNLSTSAFRSSEKISRTVHETKTYFAPLARELGIGEFHRMLEYWSLRITNPNLVHEIETILFDNERELIKRSRRVRDKLDPLFREAKIPRDKIEISAEEKILSVYSVMREWNTFSGPLIKDPLFNNHELIWVFDTAVHCYLALGIIHTLWTPLYTHFRDWINNPLPNGYCAIHTSVQVDPKELVSFRLQTREKRRISERGPLFLLRDAYDYDETYQTLPQAQLLNRIINIDKECESTQQFLEYIRLDIIPPKIRVFVQGADPCHVPNGASILDLIYICFPDYANRFTGATVNKTPVSVAYRLRDGDFVELNFQVIRRPEPDWRFGSTFFTATTKYALI